MFRIRNLKDEDLVQELNLEISSQLRKLFPVFVVIIENVKREPLGSLDLRHTVLNKHLMMETENDLNH